LWPELQIAPRKRAHFFRRCRIRRRYHEAMAFV